MKSTPFIATALLMLLASPARSDCSSVEHLRVYGEKHFKAIDGGGNNPSDSFRKSKFKLPNATSCELYITSPTLSSINCSWLVAKGIEKKPEVLQKYESLVQSLLKCIRRPETLERQKVANAQGENASMLDSFPGIKVTQRRMYDISYGYKNFWWSIELEYEVNDDVPP